MGIYSRDYVREPSGRIGGWGDDIPACKWLIIITVVVFLLQSAFSPFVDEWFSLSIDDLKTGQVWRFVTYAFLHDRSSLVHLIFNMLGLWWFGSEIERIYGSREFTLFYLASAVVAGTGFVIWELAMGLHAPVIGASGAVLATLMLFATHYPRQTIYFYGIIPLEVRWLLAIYIALDLYPVLLAVMGQLPRSNIAHAAHLLGILFGWLYRRNDWRISNWLDWNWFQSLPRRWKRSRVKKNLRVFEPEPTPEPESDLEDELDRILAKIHDQGSSSLTEREQAILTRASQQYKNRR